VGRENDHRQRRVLAIDRLEQLQAVDARHPQVGNHGCGSLDRDRGERGFAAVRRAHPIAGRREPQADQLEKVGVVVDQQDVTARCRGHGSAWCRC
jgi:hypothetical protein